MTALKPIFDNRQSFQSATYRLLPARVNRLDERRYVLTNDVGEWVVLSRQELDDLLHHRLVPGTPVYDGLEARHLLFDPASRSALDLLALKQRTRLARLADLTALHMFVVTLRCDHTCAYCQVSRQTLDKAQFDMSAEHALSAVDMVFQSPSPALKLEFQGGEPLLAFPRIQQIVTAAQGHPGAAGRDLAFVIASNLTHLSEDVLEFCGEHGVVFSTSLDGPADLHDARRVLPRASSHRATIEGIARIRAALGHHAVSALMTTSPASLTQVRRIIDEYVRLGFDAIFLRSLSPYGFAVKTSLLRRYDVDDWLRFYAEGLDYIIELNARGIPLREEYAAVLLHKMFGATASGYVDLQSPAGVGIAGVVYNYDGSIYGSDEGRMLAEMGDTTFRLGHVEEDDFGTIMADPRLQGLLDETMLESLPMCSDCAFSPYCGADPTFHRATQGDGVGHKALSDFCRKQMAVLRLLILRLQDDPKARRVLESWVQP